jgi:hypothetical protein
VIHSSVSRRANSRDVQRILPPRSYELAVKRFDCIQGRPLDQVCCQRTDRKPQLLWSVVVVIFSAPLHNVDEKLWRKFDLELLHYLKALSVFKIVYLWSRGGCCSDTVCTTGVTWTGVGLSPSFFVVGTTVNRIALSVFR